jgi:integrase
MELADAGSNAKSRLTAVLTAGIRSSYDAGGTRVPLQCGGRLRSGLWRSRRPIPPWIVHDLRRTARSLLARASVRPDICERVLGHAIPGV